MDRKWFVLECCASEAEDLLRGIDNFPGEVYDTKRFSTSGAVLEITRSNTRGKSYVVYPRDTEKGQLFTLRVPSDARRVVSPCGAGILFTTSTDINYHVFADTKTGFERGTTTFLDGEE